MPPRPEMISAGRRDVKHLLRTKCQACREPLHGYLDSEQVKVRPPVAVSLDPFDAGDVALDGAGVVLEGQAVDDGREQSPGSGVSCDLGTTLRSRTWSHRSATSGSWVASTRALPPSTASNIRVRASVRASGSSSAVGSSAISSRGCNASARATAVRCCWPPDSWWISCPAWGSRPSSSRAVRAWLRATAGEWPGGPQGDLDVLGGGEQGDEAVALQHDRYAIAGSGKAGHRLAVDQHAALGRGRQPGQDRQQAALARPRRTGDGQAVSGGDRQVDPGQDLLAVPLVAQPSCLKHVGHAPPGRAAARCQAGSVPPAPACRAAARRAGQGVSAHTRPWPPAGSPRPRGPRRRPFRRGW